MICFSYNLLRDLGVSGRDLDGIEPTGGIAISHLFSFNHKGVNGSPVYALEAEPEPRTLILVGMADRYGEGAKRAASVTELGVDMTNEWQRDLTATEREDLLAGLKRCTNPAAKVIAAALGNTTDPLLGFSPDDIVVGPDGQTLAQAADAERASKK